MRPAGTFACSSAGRITSAWRKSRLWVTRRAVLQESPCSALGVNDEPLRRSSDVEERIAGHERQGTVRCPLENVVFLRHYDFCAGHFVVVGAGRSRDHDVVAGKDFFQ